MTTNRCTVIAGLSSDSSRQEMAGLCPPLKSQVGRELDRLELILEQIKAVERERDALFATPEENTESRSSPAAILMTLKGIGTEFAPLFCPLASGREPLFQPLDYYGV